MKKIPLYLCHDLSKPIGGIEIFDDELVKLFTDSGYVVLGSGISKDKDGKLVLDEVSVLTTNKKYAKELIDFKNKGL